MIYFIKYNKYILIMEDIKQRSNTDYELTELKIIKKITYIIRTNKG